MVVRQCWGVVTDGVWAEWWLVNGVKCNDKEMEKWQPIPTTYLTESLDSSGYLTSRKKMLKFQVQSIQNEISFFLYRVKFSTENVI